jgi:hypothetical protein
MINRIIFCILLVAQIVPAQEVLSDRIKGLRVIGSVEAGLPVAGIESRPITIEFDMNEESPPDVRIRIVHCDRDWNITNNNFVNDELRNRSKESIGYAVAPPGVQLYRFHYGVRIPGIAGLDRIAQSGNYMFEIVDQQWKEVFARGRFFVTESIVGPVMSVTNRSLPSEVNPFNQVNKIEVAFTIPPPDKDPGDPFFPINFKNVDIYRNRQIFSPWRIDSDNRTPNTFVDGFGTNKLKFIVDNVTPGNSYRHFDLRNVTDYPAGQPLREKRGADVSRFQQPPRGDNHGASTLAVGSQYADYVPFQFELASETQQFESVFVVGDFNSWKPSPGSLMAYDEQSHRYLWHTTIRRGAYDYQYVVGPNDWIAVEGNDWRTINIYSAFIYYHDNRYGGFDRILGFIQRRSPGGSEPTSE